MVSINVASRIVLWLRHILGVAEEGDIHRRAILRDQQIIAKSLTFDAAYYLERYPDVRAAKLDPLYHFVAHGWRERRNPNRLFETDWYLSTYNDVLASGLNPLVHYITAGHVEGRNPGPRFDTDWYLEMNSDVRDCGMIPLAHFLAYGETEGRSAHPHASATHIVGPVLEPYDAWLSVNRLSDRDVNELRKALVARAGRMPRISLITPVYNTDERLFEEMLSSVLLQIYDDWELCLVDDASTAPHVKLMLERAAAADSRIKVRILPVNGGISVATNAGVELATGDIVAFLDHDDLITRDCLAEFAIYYADHPDVDLAYSDDDKIDVNGRRYAPQFKPDWSPVLLLSWMYISHLFTVRRSIFQQLGGFRSAFDGSQDYDFALRAAEVVRNVGHISKILYHWRAVAGSTAISGDAKPQSMEAGRLAVAEALERRGIVQAQAVHPDWAQAGKVGMFQIAFPDNGPSVCIIIPTKNHLDLLRRCVESLSRTTYRNFHVAIIDNESDDPAALNYLHDINGSDNIRVIQITNPDGKFSYARLNNEAVRQVDAEFVLFLNNDTEVITPNWLSQMMGYALMEGVGATGSRLYFADRTIQHAGITHGHNEGLAGHAFRGLPPHDWGYLGLIRSSRECAGVTAACMLTRRAVFLEFGGFDENQFAVSYNDADYCYRLVDAGLSCIYCCDAELYHYEGKSRGYNENPVERLNFRNRYRGRRDPWYNPNLSLEDERFQPATIRSETRQESPVRVLGVSHNLNNEGASTTFLDLFVGLKEAGFIDPVVLSPTDGPLRQLYESAGIKVIVAHSLLHGVKDSQTQEAAFGGLAMLFRAFDAEVVVANTLQTYWAVMGAKIARLPALWCQHESEDWMTYYDFLPADMRLVAYQGFGYAYRVLYVADATRRAWRALETRGNFALIRHGIPPLRLAEETSRWSRQVARDSLVIPEDHIVLSVVGTVCQRKGQLDVVRAVKLLPQALRSRLTVFLAGHIGEPEYGREIIDAIDTAGMDCITLTGRIADPFLYYAASDVALCSSHFESAPRVLVEAMACGLPIITTPVFGIPEIVREGINALFYPAGDVEHLARAILQLCTDEGKRKKLASQSAVVLASQPGFTDMVQQYGRVIRQAVNLED